MFFLQFFFSSYIIYKMNIGYIYKIYNDNNTYYGSTKHELKKRLQNHLNKWKLFKNGKFHFVSCFDIFKDGNYKIELVEECEYLTKYDLLNKEAEYIRNNDCVNKCIPMRTRHEYYIDNKEEIKNKRKEYYNINKEEIKKKIKEYNNINKDKIRERRILRHELTGKW